MLKSICDIIYKTLYIYHMYIIIHYYYILYGIDKNIYLISKAIFNYAMQSLHY